MPELPEVETTRRGLEPHVVGKTIDELIVREHRLRWPIPRSLAAKVSGLAIAGIERRGKYLIVDVGVGALLLHLGMSGSLRYLPEVVPLAAHDHVDIVFVDGGRLRFNDPRRFGSIVFAASPHEHALLNRLGPEPLGPDFDPAYLAARCSGRRVAIKQHLMNSRVVAGVGNIYANEALYRAGIHPMRPAGRIAAGRLATLVDATRAVLAEAIAHGGTTLRDFVGGDGRPGYFRQSLAVYDRAGEPCRRCAAPIRVRFLGQRATYYCAACQR